MAKHLAQVYNYFNREDNFEMLGKDSEILKIGNILNSIFIHREDMGIPKLTVIGGQSSGKSSVLNAILGMDILPTGNSMVTRGPLQLELSQTQGDNYAVFGEYVDGKFNETHKVPIQFPNPTMDQKTRMCSIIKLLTIKYAGEGMGITTTPIYVRIFSPHIPNISLVDLPGLTMIACTDKGQPKDIKKQIRDLLATYMRDESAIIMAVIPARTDIETDIGLALVKEFDPNGVRTIGVLTKLDLMNDGSDISRYLENNVSKDLQLKLGYFAVKNRNTLQSVHMNIREGIESESKYFKNHSVYSNSKYSHCLGIPALSKSINSVLVKAISSTLPDIRQKISKELVDYNLRVVKLGPYLPDDTALRTAYLHNTVGTVARSFISILEDRGKNIDTGRNIKYCFVELRRKIGALEPFGKKQASDAYIKVAISNCEGNHMSFPSPPVEVLEQLIKDPNVRPVQQVTPIAYQCVDNIRVELTNLVDLILKELGLTRYPKLCTLIKGACIEHVFIPKLEEIKAIISLEVEYQENYIWTEDCTFMSTLDNDSHSEIDIMRTLCSNYYSAIIYILQDTIPKKIMYHLVHGAQKEISSVLYNAIKDKPVNELLSENGGVAGERDMVNKKIVTLNNALAAIDTIRV